MNVPPSLSRVRFNPTPQVYSIPPGAAAASVSGSGVPMPACSNSMMYGGGSSSSGFNFSFQIPSFSSLFGGNMNNNQLMKILIGFLILGILGFVLHQWYRSKLQRDSNRSFLCPSWIMGKPSNQTCGMMGLTGGAQPASSVSEAISKKNQTAPGEQTAEAQPRGRGNRENFGQAIQGPVGERDTNGYTRWDERTLNPKGTGSGPTSRGVNQEYEKCMGSNPDREEVCDFWKNLESTPGVKPSRTKRRTNSQSSGQKNRQVYHPPMDFNATGLFATGMDPSWGPYARV